MTLLFWGRGLFQWGLVAMIAACLPLVSLQLLPQGIADGFYGLFAFMLALSVAPLGGIAASVGAILLLVAVVRRPWRDAAPGPSPRDPPPR